MVGRSCPIILTPCLYDPFGQVAPGLLDADFIRDQLTYARSGTATKPGWPGPLGMELIMYGSNPMELVTDKDDSSQYWYGAFAPDISYFLTTFPFILGGIPSHVCSSIQISIRPKL